MGYKNAGLTFKITLASDLQAQGGILAPNALRCVAESATLQPSLRLRVFSLAMAVRLTQLSGPFRLLSSAFGMSFWQ